MYKFDERVSHEIGSCLEDPSINPYRWLEEEINSLALKFTGLDELPKKSLITLAQVSSKGPMSVTALASQTGFEIDEVDDHLDALQSGGLLTNCSSGYEVTEKGKEVFRALGTNIVIRKRLEMRRHFEHLDSLYRAITPMWHGSSQGDA